MKPLRVRKPAAPPTGSEAVRTHGGMLLLLLNSRGVPPPTVSMSFCSDRRVRTSGGKRSAFINGCRLIRRCEEEKGAAACSPFLLKKSSGNTWQAYTSPASLGFPLSVPAACGLYEIFHLKCSLYYYSSIIAGLSPLVKNRFIPN